MMILIAAAAGADQVIGDRGKLPWHYAADLQFFKRMTLDHCVLMGRVTFASIIAQYGRPLPRRRHLVVSRDPNFSAPGAEVFTSIDAAQRAVPIGEDIYVVGGQQIYEQCLSRADVVLLTHIDRRIEGDAFFPPLDPKIWRVEETERITETDGTVLRFCRYTRPAPT